MTYLHSFTKKCHLLSITARLGLVLMLLSALLFGAAPPRTAQAQGIIRVTTTGATSGTCGDTWVSACDLQYALTTVAVSGDEIWVAEGTYKPTSGTDRTATFQLKSGVALYGGFAGWEISRAQRDWTRHETILSGDLNGDDDGFTNNGENSYHVVTGSGTDATAILDRFTVTGGHAIDPGSVPGGSGGGMYNDSGSPTLTNVTFSGNSAQYGGGGMYNDSGSPTLTNVTFSGNSAGGGGGMFCRYDGSPTLANVTFSGNSAQSGGGMWIRKCNPRLYNGTFSGNSVSYRGGGIYISGYHGWSNNLQLHNVVFSGNTAGDRGGGITISTLPDLGKVSVHLRNVTLSGNSAAEWGGGMTILGEGASATLINSILWGNTAPQGPQVDLGFGSLYAAYSDVQDGWGGAHNINADPQFVDADGADDIVGTLDDNLRLKSTSPAIDAGTNDAVSPDIPDLDRDGDTSEPLPDRDGNLRIVNETVDMGAYEAGCYNYYLEQGNVKIGECRKYRNGFHAETTITATVTLANVREAYAASVKHCENAVKAYELAARCALTDADADRNQALTSLLNAHWELATGATLTGNESMVQALDFGFEDPIDPLGEEIEQLQVAINWYTQATGRYTELLASEHFSDVMALQPSRVHPISGDPTPYLDLQRLALASAKKSRAYLEKAERQYRKFTPDSKAEAENTLRQGFSLATAELTLLESPWDDAVDDVGYHALLRNISDMQRLFRYLQEGKNPFGYGPEHVPFHFQPKHWPDNNYEQTKALADAEWDAANEQVENAVGKQQESDDNWVILQQRLEEIRSKYNSQLVQFCGTNAEGEPDLEKCHENSGGEISAQLLRIEAANQRIELVLQQTENQNKLIRIEQDRAAKVAGIQTATAEMWNDKGEKLADLASQEVSLRDSKSTAQGITGIFQGLLETCKHLSNTIAAKTCWTA